jgi:hypothetical protein
LIKLKSQPDLENRYARKRTEKGLSIFKERRIDSNLELPEAEGYTCGIAVIRYGPRGCTPAKAKA